DFHVSNLTDHPVRVRLVAPYTPYTLFSRQRDYAFRLGPGETWASEVATPERMNAPAPGSAPVLSVRSDALSEARAEVGLSAWREFTASIGDDPAADVHLAIVREGEAFAVVGRRRDNRPVEVRPLR